MRFRPCIDLHQGKVKQIVGSSLGGELKTNFVSERSAKWYASQYQKDGLLGGHVIQLGPGNLEAAQEALSAFPQGLQLGGGVTEDNASLWLDQGAQAVIVTSYVFTQGQLDQTRLSRLNQKIGKKHLVLDLSCRKKDGKYWVVSDLWQKFTNLEVCPKTLDQLAGQCDEFLIHSVDVEGKGLGIDEDLLNILGSWSGLKMTYAGGVRNWDDIGKIKTLGQSAIDFTVGSALDLFGGEGLKYADLVARQGSGF